MTDNDKALVEELRYGNWILEDPSDGLGYPNDSPLVAADRIETLNAMLKAAEESLGDQLAARKEQADEIVRLREALGLFDDLIKHQYSGSQEAMSDMTYAAQNAARVLKRGAWAALGETDHVSDEMTKEDYEAIYGWGGQG
jgi:hypothetical protein